MSRRWTEVQIWQQKSKLWRLLPTLIPQVEEGVEVEAEEGVKAEAETTIEEISSNNKKKKEEDGAIRQV